MCGIIGFAKSGNAPLRCSDVLVEGLRKLEYRGYDSVGVAVVSKNGGFVIIKDVGSVDRVVKAPEFEVLDGSVAIGHTRWATHGKPSKENAHPHTDCSKRVAVVHNGIIENYLELKNVVLGEGHVFMSETDTEVVAHLIEHFKKLGAKPFEAFKKAVAMLRGSYALAVVDLDEPDRIFFARSVSPLVIGLGNNINFVSSDITAFVKYTNRVVVLQDGEVGYVSSSEVYVEFNGRPVDVSSRIRLVELDAQSIEKGGFPHYMTKEIFEQPYALAQTFSALQTQNISDVLRVLEEARKIYIVGAGTSYHASLLGAIAFKRFLGLDAEALISSEFRVISRAVKWGDVVIGVSQSGETIDTLLALREARERGAKTVALVNNQFSTIARESDYVISMRAGPEIAVAATKTFTTQVLSLLYIVARLAEFTGAIDVDYKALIQGLKMSHEVAQRVLEACTEVCKAIATRLAEKQSAYYLGRVFGVPIAMEGALKLKEIAYIHAEAYPAGESKHGPIALVEEGFPVVFIYLGFLDEMLESNVEEMKARGAYVIAVAQGDTVLGSIAKYSNAVVKMPKAPLEVRLITYVIPLQLIAYYTSVIKGLDPDKPRNLAKTVTVI
ncbi:MAG: glutamine--fructose-6-phosphate transaminase (isomerizing) [Ignisphaera sp.]|nr:glutamine--fructose-6-phosphate transaminase (isomerizing) [Ignisphaera sp.]